MFCPTVLNPSPDPWFVRELRIIDPLLRVVFGYERYLLRNWVVERRVPPERYATIYKSFIESGEPRFVQQPVYDTKDRLTDDNGDDVGAKIIGYRTFDMAPDWEWVKTIQMPTGEFKPLGDEDILSLKREYAWNRNHAYSRARFEEEQRLKDEKKEAESKQKRMDAWMESYDEALLVTGQRVVSRPYTRELTEKV